MHMAPKSVKSGRIIQSYSAAGQVPISNQSNLILGFLIRITWENFGDLAYDITDE